MADVRRLLLFALLSWVVLSWVVADTRAQAVPALLTSPREAGRVSLSAVYQRYTDDGAEIAQVSFPLAAYVSLGRRLDLNLFASASQATGTVAGDDLASVGGLSDAQLILGYSREVGGGSLVATLGANLPSGKRALSSEEFETSRQLSRDVYHFRMPSFGQGFNVSPGLTWAMPVADDVVVGLGVSYQYRGSFTPLSDMEQDFDPGDELAFTGGVDYRFSRTTALSADVTYTTYGTDRQGETDLFDAGNKATATVQLLHFQGYDELRLVAHYRSRGKSSLPGGAEGLAGRSERLSPNQALLRAAYRLRLRGSLSVGLLAQGRYYDAVAGFDEQTLVDLGVLPEVGIARDLTLVTQFVYTLGSFSGLEGGFGLSMRF